ncbi:hypothetical protein IFM89_021833 [Coptis chinensis]|uniref:Protein yippee-like n=1 Tax=Coptis chinensis TaxID=261450 RepID=A0A835I5Z1_9MAGN|nr:hypothetical protein IFM89_021833 [Coptis chinensis]
MGRLFIESVPTTTTRIYKCKYCKVDLASYDELESKEFQGRYGKAYLFKTVVNLSVGPVEDRELSSGLHKISDIYCTSCQQILGWKYAVWTLENLSFVVL